MNLELRIFLTVVAWGVPIAMLFSDQMREYGQAILQFYALVIHIVFSFTGVLAMLILLGIFAPVFVGVGGLIVGGLTVLVLLYVIYKSVTVPLAIIRG